MPALLLAILVALLLAPSAQAAPREVPEGFMGVMADGPLVDQGITDISREGALMQRSGVEAIRIVVYWADLQPTRDGPIDWASTDRVVAMAAANRLKILPVFRIGAEAERGGAYESWQRLREGEVPEGGWDHLQCSSCRMVTDQGVWVCPILVNEPEAKMGETLADTLGAFPLEHPACWTCHAYGVSCRT